MIQAILTERILKQVCSACILNRYTNVLGVYEAPDFLFQGLEKSFIVAESPLHKPIEIAVKKALSNLDSVI